MQSDSLKAKRSRLFCTLISDQDQPILKKRDTKVTTAKEVRDQLKILNKKIDNFEDRNIADLPNIGLNLVKTTHKLSLSQEYLNQLVEDIENRLLCTYESSEFNGSLFLIRNAKPENLKVALLLIFSKHTKKCKTLDKKITYLQFRFPAFSILQDKKWLRNQLRELFQPAKTSPRKYEIFIYFLGYMLEIQFNRQSKTQMSTVRYSTPGKNLLAKLSSRKLRKKVILNS